MNHFPLDRRWLASEIIPRHVVEHQACLAESAAEIEADTGLWERITLESEIRPQGSHRQGRNLLLPALPVASRLRAPVFRRHY
jgi:hypothetical protein